MPFDDLGFDSLSRMEPIERLADGHALPMPDEMVDELTTPNALLGYVQSEIGTRWPARIPQSAARSSATAAAHLVAAG